MEFWKTVRFWLNKAFLTVFSAHTLSIIVCLPHTARSQADFHRLHTKLHFGKEPLNEMLFSLAPSHTLELDSSLEPTDSICSANM